MRMVHIRKRNNRGLGWKIGVREGNDYKTTPSYSEKKEKNPTRFETLEEGFFLTFPTVLHPRPILNFIVTCT